MKRAIALLALLIALTASAEEITGRVIGVVDGDTINVLADGRQMSIRLSDIDAPEKGQAFAQASKQSLSDVVFGKDVRIDVRGKDGYGRTIGRIFVGALDVNQRQVEAGMAWAYRKYTHDPRIVEAESRARVKASGLWSANDQTPPWDYRQGRKESDFSPPEAPTTARSDKGNGEHREGAPISLGKFFKDREYPDGYEAGSSGGSNLGTGSVGSGRSRGGGTIYTGPRGGRYTITSGGNKSYVGSGGGSGKSKR